MPLVEVIPHASTSPQTVATVVKLAKMQGKTAIVVADKAGFYVNRVLVPYINEAMRLLTEGEDRTRRRGAGEVWVPRWPNPTFG